MVQYDVITILKALELAEPVPSFLLDTFARAPGTEDFVPTETAQVDVRKGDTRMAPFVAPHVGGVVVRRDGFTTETIHFPTLAPELPVSRAEVITRAFGEMAYSGVTEAQRAMALMQADLRQLRDMIAVRKEWMIAQLLQYGTMDIDLFQQNGQLARAYTVDFGFENILAPSSTWDQASSDPNQDMQALYDAVREGRGNVDVIIMGKDAGNAFLRNEKVMKQLDIRRMEFGQGNPARRLDGVRYIGVNEDGIELYAYYNTFTDADGNRVPFIAPGRVIAGRKASFRRMYGPVIQVEGGAMKSYLAAEVPHRFASEQNNVITQRLTSRPMIVPDNVDGWAVMEVL